MGTCESQMELCAKRGRANQLQDENMLGPSGSAEAPKNCGPECRSALDKASTCIGGRQDEYHFVRDARFNYDDEVKPPVWVLSEQEQWKEETGQNKQKSTFKKEMEEWRRIEDTYVLQEKFKNGSYGVSVPGYCKTLGVLRAIKHVPKVQEQQVNAARDEARNLAKLDHPNIITLAETIEDNVSFYLVTDFCEGGALTTYLQDGWHFTEGQALMLLRQMLSAIRYLHEEIRLCHRDLKLDNCLLANKDPVETSNVLKIIDFRKSANIVQGGFFCENVMEVYQYVSPEMLKHRYNEKVDIWSCGVILYVLLCGYFPFQAGTVKEIRNRIFSGNFNTSYNAWQHVSEGSKNLLRGLLKFKYLTRFSAEEASNHEVMVKKTPAVQWV